MSSATSGDSVMSTPHGFWIAATNNRVFDGVVTRHLIAHGDIVAINAFYDFPSYSYADIVRRLKRKPSRVRVLFYTWAGRKYRDADTIAAIPTLDGMEGETGFLLKDRKGDVLIVGDEGSSFILLDPRVSGARDWLACRVRAIAELVGSDGVALDSAIRRPHFLDRIDDPDDCYPQDFDSMILGVTTRTPLTIVNNLSARSDQEPLLKAAYGASIERFGLNDTISRSPTFGDDIQPYLDVIGRYDERTFLVFGRASRDDQPYTTYDEDWHWQRYLYSAYLLAAGANTRWKQHAGFQTSPFGGRAGGLEVYADALHDLGAPLGPYAVNDGCYRRECERGLVLVVPLESPQPITVQIQREMFTPEGTPIVGKLTMAPGEGQLLLQHPPAPPSALSRVFNPRSNPFWRWSALRLEASTWYLHLEQTDVDDEAEHDLALDLVRYRAPRAVATLWYRTADPSARVETVVEVDDDERTVRFALVNGALETGGTEAPRRGQFRGMPQPASQFFRLPVIGGGTPLKPDGQWHRMVIDLAAACTRSSRYSFDRALFMRLLGSLDIRQVWLHSQPVLARTRAAR
jgi:Hypothetical glycosyl hydrolase family 15